MKPVPEGLNRARGIQSLIYSSLLSSYDMRGQASQGRRLNSLVEPENDKLLMAYKLTG